MDKRYFLVMVVVTLLCSSLIVAQVDRPRNDSPIVVPDRQEIREQIRGGLREQVQEIREERMTHVERRQAEIDRLRRSKGSIMRTHVLRRGDGSNLSFSFEERLEGDDRVYRVMKYTHTDGNDRVVHTRIRLLLNGSNVSNNRLRAVLSSGDEREVLGPESVKDRLRSRYRFNASNVTLFEDVDREVPRVLYRIQGKKEGRFLGVFRMGMRFDAAVDAETGELVDEDKPWWAFLVRERLREENVGDEVS